MKFYLEELSNYFSEIILLTNVKKLSEIEQNYLLQHKIQIRFYENEGMDFGMWYKAFAELQVEDYYRIGLVNDSCILFKSLKPVFVMAEKSDADAYGMVLTGKFSTHLQSYFILLNKGAILPTKDFFVNMGILKSYKKIIFQYEIGLSQHLLKNNLKLDAFFDYSINKTQNPSYILAKELIKSGSPLIKKKLVNRNFTWGDYLTWMRNDIDIDSRKYLRYISENNKDEKLINMKTVMAQLGSESSRSDIYLYRLTYFFYKIFYKVSFFRFLFHQSIKLKRLLLNGS